MNLIEKLEQYNWVYEDKSYFYLYRHQPIEQQRLENFINNNFWFTAPERFNDPFDCGFFINEKFLLNRQDLQRIYQEKSGKKLKYTESLRLYQKAKYNLKKQNASGEYVKNFLKDTGVICLNHNPLNILMWSHYANFHQGFMIEYKFSKQVPELYKDFISYPVEYTNEYPIIDEHRTHTVEDIGKRFFTKSLEWSYEKEFRIVRMELKKQNRLQEYPKSLIASVIAGLKVSESDYDKLRETLNKFNKSGNHTEIKLYRCHRVNTKYEITVPNHPRLDVLTKSTQKK